MSLVERAKAAAVAERETAELQRQARIVANRARVVELIQEMAERLGLDLAADQIGSAVPPAELHEGSEYGYEEALTPDATLVIKGRIGVNQPKLTCEIVPNPTLHRNLPPEGEQFRGGRIIGNYGLKGSFPVETLAEVGVALELIEKAREEYDRYWEA